MRTACLPASRGFSVVTTPVSERTRSSICARSDVFRSEREGEMPEKIEAKRGCPGGTERMSRKAWGKERVVLRRRCRGKSTDLNRAEMEGRMMKTPILSCTFRRNCQSVVETGGCTRACTALLEYVPQVLNINNLRYMKSGGSMRVRTDPSTPAEALYQLS